MTFNPASVAARSAKAPRVRDLLKSWELEKLKSEAAVRNSRFFLAEKKQSDVETAALWLIHEEMTRRGIAPRFRSIPNLRAATYIKGQRWIDATPSSIANALQMARAIDLEWLIATPNRKSNSVVRRLQSEGLAAKTTLSIMRSEQSRTKLSVRLGLSISEQLAMASIVGTDAQETRRRVKIRSNRFCRIIDEHRGDHYRLPESDLSTRKAWAEAICYAEAEMPRPTGDDIARWMTLTSGLRYSRQNANKMRRRLSHLEDSMRQKMYGET